MPSAPNLPAGLPSVVRAKRGLDVVGALAGLIVFAPLVALAAAAVRLESTGPLIVRRLRAGTQRRRPASAGRGGRRLHDAGGELFMLPRMRVQGRRDQPTLGGRFLRATRLESWPQLWMVLTGRMSLVGPRPLTPRQAARLAEDVPCLAEELLGVRPGMFATAPVDPLSRRPVIAAGVARVVHDLPYAARVRTLTRGWQVLAIDLRLMWTVFSRPFRRSGSFGNDVLSIDLPREFEQLAADADKLAGRPPRGMSFEVHARADRVVAWWYPRRADGPDGLDNTERPSPLSTEWCDARHVFEPHEIVLVKDLQPAPGGEDEIRLEVPARLSGLVRLCEHLQPLWRSLQWRDSEPDFALRQNLALVEAMAHLASRAGPGERLVITIQVGPSCLRSRIRRAPALEPSTVTASGLLRPLIDGLESVEGEFARRS